MELMPISEVYRFVFRIETQCISHIDSVTVACGKTGIDRYRYHLLVIVHQNLFKLPYLVL